MTYSFPNLDPVHCSMSSSNCCFLICIQISQEAGQLVWCPHLLKKFSQFVVIYTVKCFNIVNEADIDVFLEFPRLFWDPADVGNLISGSSAFSKFSLNICKFMVHMLLRPSLENFQHCFASVWNGCNCMVLWTFLGILLSLIVLNSSKLIFPGICISCANLILFSTRRYFFFHLLFQSFCPSVFLCLQCLSIFPPLPCYFSFFSYHICSDQELFHSIFSFYWL